MDILYLQLGPKVSYSMNIPENGVLLCPSISKKPRISHILELNVSVKSCPSGHEVLTDAFISMSHVGALPKVVKGKELRGSVFSLMDLLGKRFNFQYTSAGARGFSGMVMNVSVWKISGKKIVSLVYP